MNSYLTLASEASAELVERRSRFIATVRPVESSDEALDFVAQLKQQYKDATHNVWAYRIDSGNMRASDDGEPSGTAGTPVLQVLCKQEICRAAIVVTRYFGGVLLGAGGLVRAYGSAAALGVEAAGIATMTPCDLLTIVCSYADSGRVRNYLDNSPAVVTGTDYGADVVFSLRCASPSQELVADINELCSARAKIALTGSGFFPM